MVGDRFTTAHFYVSCKFLVKQIFSYKNMYLMEKCCPFREQKDFITLPGKLKN